MMSSATLKAAIKTAMIDDCGAVDSDTTDDFAQALAVAIVDHITTYAVVPAGIAVNVDPNTGIGATTGTGTVA